MNLKNIMLVKKLVATEHILYESIYSKSPKKRQMYRNIKEICGCLWLGVVVQVGTNCKGAQGILLK